MVFFLALHDLGKFSDGFQNLRPTILLLLQKRKSKRAYCERHDTFGYILWLNQLKKEFSTLGILKVGSGRRKTTIEIAMDFWMSAVTH